MRALSLAACLHPHPALLMIYAERNTIDSKLRKRLMPVRDKQVGERSELQQLESLADHLIDRHPDHLPAVPRRLLLQVLRVLQLLASGVPESRAIREAEVEFKQYTGRQKGNKAKKRVSFREGPHDERHYDKDDDNFSFKLPAAHVPELDLGPSDQTADGGETRRQLQVGDVSRDDMDDQSSSSSSQQLAAQSAANRETDAVPADADADSGDFESEEEMEQGSGDSEVVESPEEEDSEMEAAAILLCDPDDEEDDELFVF